MSGEGGSHMLVRSDFRGNTLEGYDVTHASDVTTQNPLYVP